MKKIQRISYKSDSNTNEPRDNFIIITHGIRNVQIHINCIGNYNFWIVLPRDAMLA